MKPLELYDAWKAQPGPATLTPLVKSLQPTIQRSLSSHGFDKDPNMVAAARLHLSKGLPRYDPEKSALNTWATNELRRMPRIGHRQRHAVPIPERAAVDLRGIEEVEKRLQFQLGRTPTAGEIADDSGLSTRRIAKIRSKFGTPTITENMTADATGLNRSLGTHEINRDKIVLELIYAELQPIDQQIMDHTFGWHGAPKLQKNEIAKRLKRSPASITQRSAAIATKVDALDLEAVM